MLHVLLLLELVGVNHDWLSDLSIRAIRSGHLHRLAVGVGLLHLSVLLLHWHSVGVHLGHGRGIGWGSMEAVVVADIVSLRNRTFGKLISASSIADVDGTTDESKQEEPAPVECVIVVLTSVVPEVAFLVIVTGVVV